MALSYEVLIIKGVLDSRRQLRALRLGRALLLSIIQAWCLWLLHTAGIYKVAHRLKLTDKLVFLDG